MHFPQLARYAAAALIVLAPPAGAGFVDDSASTGIFGSQPTWGAQAVDMDGDGDVDLLSSHHFYSAFIFTNYGGAHFDVFGIPQIVTTSGDRHAFLWADLDGDGITDVVCSHGGDGGSGFADDPNELWRGLGGGIYSPVAGAGGMADSVGRGRAFSAADIDLDGDPDLYHAKAPLAASPNSLYRNDGSMTFTDIAPSAGLDETAGTQAGLFEDYDNDGDPDLLVGGQEFDRPTILFRNDGGVFTDVTAWAFGSLPVITFADWGDYDNDEDVDLVITEGHEGFWDMWKQNGTDYWLFQNFRYGEDGIDRFWFETPGEDPQVQFRFLSEIQNDRIFLGPQAVHPPDGSTIVTLSDDYVGAPVFTPGVDEGLYCWRESPGGRWQIHVSSPAGTYGSFSARVFTTGGVTGAGDSNLEQPNPGWMSPRVYRNDHGKFAEVTSSLGIYTVVNPRAVQWVDFDNDGDLDLHQVNMGNVDVGPETDILWRNDGSVLTPLTGPGWAPGSTQYYSDGGVWADFDGDSDLDLILQEGSGPRFFAGGAPTIYYRNDGPVGNALDVTLGPSTAGSTPIGAKATCWVGGMRVHRRLRADSWEGFQRPLSLHFGLGNAASFDSLVVVWPDGERRVIPGGQDPTGAIPGTHADPSVAAGYVGSLIPQPAFGRQTLSVDVPPPGRLRVSILDAAGRRVRVLDEGLLPRPGVRSVIWDGRDAAGRPVPPGVYFLRGEGDLRFTRKAVRLR